METINIPNNATNGDVIRMLFPNYFYAEGQTFTYIYVDEKHLKKGKYLVRYSTKWWNKPYKA